MTITLCMILDALMAAHPDMLIGNYHSCPVAGIKLLPKTGGHAPGHLNVGLREGRLLLLCGEGEDLGVETDLALEEIFNELQDAYTALRNWDREMNLLMLRGGSLQELLDISTPVIGNPITIMDPGFKLIAYTRAVTSHSKIYNEVLKYGCLPEHIIEEHEKVGVFPAMLENSPAQLTQNAPDHVTLLQAIYVDHRIAGQVAMPCTARLYTEGLAEQFDVLLANGGGILESERHNQTVNRYMHEYFLAELIESGVPGDESFSERLKYIGLPSQGSFCLFHLHQGRHDPYLSDFHAGRIAALLPGEKVFTLRGELYVLVNQQGHSLSYRDHILRALKRMDSFLRREGLVCGVSARFADIRKIGQAHTQADAALKLGGRISRTRALEKLGVADLRYPDTVFEYDDYRLHHMIDCCAQQIALEDLCAPELLRLIATDREEGANHCEVLYHYLIRERRTTETAERLHMHRNNVIYRIGKIQDMLDIDLDDAEVRKKLLLSFAVVELMES